MELAQAIRIILNTINDAETLLEGLDYTEGQWDDLDNAIDELQHYLITKTGLPAE